MILLEDQKQPDKKKIFEIDLRIVGQS